MLCITAAYAVVLCLSVRPSVTFVYSVETSKRIFKYFSQSGSCTILVFRYQTSWQYSDGDPLTGALNVSGVGKNRNSRRISGYQIDDWRSANNSCDRVHHAVYHTDRHASVSLYLSQPAWTTTTKRREQSLFVRSAQR